MYKQIRYIILIVSILAQIKMSCKLQKQIVKHTFLGWRAIWMCDWKVYLKVCFSGQVSPTCFPLNVALGLREWNEGVIPKVVFGWVSSRTERK